MILYDPFVMVINATPLEIPDVLLIEPEIIGDARGHFFEVWNRTEFAKVTGFGGDFAQDNQSRSQSGVLRGLHYQLPNPQGKLVRVAAGAAFTVAVDIRRSSSYFGKAVTVHLSAHKHNQLWIPPGFAHGFLSMADPTDVLYKVTTPFSPDCDREIRWNDPDLAIDWPLDGLEPIMTDRDRSAPLLRDGATFA